MKHCLTFILIISLSSFSLAKTEPVFPDIELPKSLYSIQQEIEKNNQAVLSKITKKTVKQFIILVKKMIKMKPHYYPIKKTHFIIVLY